MAEKLNDWRAQARAVVTDPTSRPSARAVAWAFLRQHGAATAS